MELRQLRYSHAHRKVDRDVLIRELKRHLDENQPIRDEALLVGGLLDAIFARYYASDRQLKRYEQLYLELAKGLVHAVYEEIRTRARGSLPNRLWDGDQGLLNARLVIRYVIQHKARWKLDDRLPEKANTGWFNRVHLSRMLNKSFGGSPIRAMQAAYPEYFFDLKHPTKLHLWHPWDFPQKPMWQGRAGDVLAKRASRHLIEVHEGWKLDETLPGKATQNWFRKVGLAGMLAQKFPGSPFSAIRAAYPEHFFDPKDPTKPHLWHSWDFGLQRMWQGKAGQALARQALRHVIEVHEGWKLDETLPRKARRAWFQRAGLGGMFAMVFRQSPLLAFQAAYPEHFFDPKHPTKPHLWHDWDFKKRRGMWRGKAGDNLARQAIRDLMEGHEGWKLDESLPQKATEAWFWKVGLRGALRKFRTSPFCAIRAVYPEHFFDPRDPTKPHLWHEWDFHYRAGMWRGKAGDNLARQAIRHLMEVHEGWPVDRTLPKRTTKAWFLKVGLSGMLYVRFRRHPAAALRFAYPHLFGPNGRWPLRALRRRRILT